MAICTRLTGHPWHDFFVPKVSDVREIFVRLRALVDARLAKRRGASPTASAEAESAAADDRSALAPNLLLELLEPRRTRRAPGWWRRSWWSGLVRVYVAGAPDAPLTIVALETLARNPAVRLVGISFGRIPGGPPRRRARHPPRPPTST
ncbi:MAG: hypothetical protein U0838_04050 [Chloroflexota bacterium]